MKCYYPALAMLLFVGLPTTMLAGESPIRFARSGQNVKVSVEARKDGENRFLLLTANGQSWSQPVTAKGSMVEFRAPDVRVPVVFHLALADDGTRIAPGEFVVYPDRWLPWEKDKRLSKYKEIQFVAVNARIGSIAGSMPWNFLSKSFHREARRGTVIGGSWRDLPY